MSTATPNRPRARRPCPRCHCGLRRVQRNAWDKAKALFFPLAAARSGRYRCLATGCGWQGVIERKPRSGAAPSLLTQHTATGRQILQGLVGAAALAGLALATTATVRIVSPPVETVQVGPNRVERGVSHDGVALPPDHPLLTTASPMVETDEVEPPAVAGSGAANPGRVAFTEPPLTLRRHCAWGQPGRNPYQGSIEVALRSARLPESMVQRIAADVKARKVTDRLSISSRAIRADASGRRFDPSHVAMTYGKTLCVDTKVNFAKGHVERADLYEASDGKGNVVAVMVPDVCGNVSVLSEVAEDEDLKAEDAAKREGRSATLRRLPQPLIYNKSGDGGGGRVVRPGQTAQAVSAPTTIACSLLGLVALGWFSRRARRQS